MNCVHMVARRSCSICNRAPNIQTDAPSAPGSETSREAASKVTNPIRARSYRLIFAALAAAGYPLTREELSERTGIKESSLCGRLFELRPTWVWVTDQKVVAASGCVVDTYLLTALGYQRWDEANRPLALPLERAS